MIWNWKNDDTLKCWKSIKVNRAKIWWKEPFRGVPWNRYIFKGKQNLENDLHIYSFFKTVAGGKPAASPKKDSFGIFLRICSVCFEISKYFKNIICLYSPIMVICVNYEEPKMIYRCWRIKLSCVQIFENWDFPEKEV